MAGGVGESLRGEQAPPGAEAQHGVLREENPFPFFVKGEVRRIWCLSHVFCSLGQVQSMELSVARGEAGWRRASNARPRHLEWSPKPFRGRVCGDTPPISCSPSGFMYIGAWFYFYV